jgi:hypothetical protein
MSLSLNVAEDQWKFQHNTTLYVDKDDPQNSLQYLRKCCPKEYKEYIDGYEALKDHDSLQGETGPSRALALSILQEEYRERLTDLCSSFTGLSEDYVIEENQVEYVRVHNYKGSSPMDVKAYPRRCHVIRNAVMPSLASSKLYDGFSLYLFDSTAGYYMLIPVDLAYHIPEDEGAIQVALCIDPRGYKYVPKMVEAFCLMTADVFLDTFYDDAMSTRVAMDKYRNLATKLLKGKSLHTYIIPRARRTKKLTSMIIAYLQQLMSLSLTLMGVHAHFQIHTKSGEQALNEQYEINMVANLGANQISMGRKTEFNMWDVDDEDDEKDYEDDYEDPSDGFPDVGDSDAITI